jgi:hypothetical protein
VEGAGEGGEGEGEAEGEEEEEELVRYSDASKRTFAVRNRFLPAMLIEFPKNVPWD